MVHGKTKYPEKSVNLKINTFGIKIAKGDDIKGYLSEKDMGKTSQEKINENLKNKNIYDAGSNNGFNVSQYPPF